MDCNYQYKADCIKGVEIMTKSSPFSLFQEYHTTQYDVCAGKVIQEGSYKDINHYFGVIVVLAFCVILLGVMLKLDKNENTTTKNKERK